METTPLEALTVGPDEILIIRLPAGQPEEYAITTAEQVAVWAEAAGISDRVLVVSDEIELAKVGR